MNTAYLKALEHAQRLVDEYAKTGDPPHNEDYLEAAKEVANALPGTAGDVAAIAMAITSLVLDLYDLLVETRDEKAAALGSAAGLAAYRAGKKAH